MEEIKTVNVGNALADYISAKKYGDFVYSQEIERVTGTKYGDQKYYSSIAKAKKILIGRGKAIKLDSKGTYKVLYPGDYADAYTREIRLANKRVKRGGKILDGAPKKDMSASEISVFNNVSDFHKRLEARFRGDYVEVKALSGRKHPFEVAK